MFLSIFVWGVVLVCGAFLCFLSTPWGVDVSGFRLAVVARFALPVASGVLSRVARFRLRAGSW